MRTATEVQEGNRTAFPWPSAEMCGYNHESGMTLRDYFAAKAMQTLLQESARVPKGPGPKTIARDSYSMADLMLEARNQ